MKKSEFSLIKKALLGLIVLSIAVAMYVTACQRPAPTPTSAPEKALPTSINSNTNDNVATIDPADTPKTGIKKANFPLYLDNVPSILHPITPVNTNDKASKMISKGGYDRDENDNTTYFHEVSPYQFSGTIYNLVFEKIATGATQRLFPNDSFMINSMIAPFVDIPLTKELKNLKNASNTPEVIAQATDKQEDKQDDRKTSSMDKKLMGYFIYQVQEKPTNNEDKSNLDSQQSLYLSDFNGGNLTELHPNTEYVKSVKWLPELERYYFITQSDSNHDKNITIDDTYHNYMIDFKKAREAQTSPKAVAYHLLK